jgi:hypothetical protein
MSRYQALTLSLAGLLHSLNLSPFTGKMHVESSQGRGKTSVSSDGRTSRPGTAQGALPKGSRLRGCKPQRSKRWLGKGNSQEGVDPHIGALHVDEAAPHLPCVSGPDGSG